MSHSVRDGVTIDYWWCHATGRVRSLSASHLNENIVFEMRYDSQIARKSRICCFGNFLLLPIRNARYNLTVKWQQWSLCFMWLYNSQFIKRYISVSNTSLCFTSLFIYFVLDDMLSGQFIRVDLWSLKLHVLLCIRGYFCCSPHYCIRHEYASTYTFFIGLHFVCMNSQKDTVQCGLMNSTKLW